MSEAEDLEIPEQKPCVSCGAPIDLNNKFCKNCGIRQSDEDIHWLEKKWSLLKQASLFYLIYIGLCALSRFTDAFETIPWFLFLEVVLAGTAVIFFALNWAENKQLLIWRNFSWQKLAAYAAIAITGAFLVHYSVNWLNITVFSRDDHYYSIFAGSRGASFLIILCTAVTPALFEELGFRGYLLQTLIKVTDKEQAVYISAFLFAIIHLSLVSLFWLIPFALFIGYVRIKENTLWYGVFFHFCFNLTACLFELL